MKLTFLGTGAAEGIPSPFCDCSTCEHARVHGGRNIRKRQSVLINDHLLVDLGPDIFASCAQLGISLCQVDRLLVTHSHSDHFDPSNLMLRAKTFRLETELPEMTVVAGPSVWTIWDASGGSDQQAGIKRVPILPGRAVQLGAYSVRSFAATHHSRIGDAMNYVIQDETATLLYASDSGVYAEEIWRELEVQRVELDAVVLEGTIWTRPPGKEHLNEGDFQLMLERLREIGAVTDSTVVIATHFSHQGSAPYEELAQRVKKLGGVCAYDGFEVSFGRE
ncbi:MBL fold metallo-hydrolase [Paenibacillus senegalensis]|uniref:MBL fold metallo-hydrolase n=1 Tax=Paenibacillus senegalensis TaxID=1465766 RepID=UPI000288679C|nr:MBL fold metallo-hydrolase [Paenibacillus senegalensis]